MLWIKRCFINQDSVWLTFLREDNNSAELNEMLREIISVWTPLEHFEFPN